MGGISEFGVYSSYICDDKGHVECDEIIGTLVRTKPMNISQGGVFSGYAVFDSVFVDGMELIEETAKHKSSTSKSHYLFNNHWNLLSIIICLVAIAIAIWK